MSDTQKHKKPNVPNLRFPEFSGEWESTTVGKMGSVVGGGTPDTNIKDYWNGGIQWFTPSEVGKEKYVSNSIRTISLKGIKNSSAKLLPARTILLSSRATVGECSINMQECCTNQGFQSIIPNTNVVIPEFLYYRIVTHKRDFIKKACGSTFLEISAKQVAKQHSFVPSNPEQNKIATLLSLIDERISIQNKVIEKYESLIKAITDKVVERLLKGRLVAFRELYTEASEGGTPSTSEHKYYENGSIPFIKIDDLSSKYLTTNKDFITELGVQKSTAWIIPENSVIFSNGATIGAISINTYPVCTKQGILGIVPKPGVGTEYLYYLMSSSYFNKQIQRIVTEGTMKTAYLKDINHIKCPLPTTGIQEKMVSGLSSITSKIDLEKQIRNKLLSTKNYLLQSLFI